ncbi:MAG: hypothetical protein ACLUGQ_10220 [Coprococcus sp.]
MGREDDTLMMDQMGQSQLKLIIRSDGSGMVEVIMRQVMQSMDAKGSQLK